MSVEIIFPIEFAVFGTPVSAQAKWPASRAAWKARVKQASYQALPEGHFQTDRSLAVTLLYFPRAQIKGDLDNIVKPVLDALCRHIYQDDRQVERIWVQKFEPGRIRDFLAVSPVLTDCISAEKPLLFIRIEDSTEGLP